MKKAFVLLMLAMLPGCAQREAEYLTPEQRTARMQAAASIMGAMNRPAAYQAPYVVPVRPVVTTNCMNTAPGMATCNSY